MPQYAILRFAKHKGNPARPLEAHHERDVYKRQGKYRDAAAALDDVMVQTGVAAVHAPGAP